MTGSQERWKAICASAALAIAALACTPFFAHASPAPVEIPTPAAPGSREPNFARLADGTILMSWLEPAGARDMALRCARFDGATWSKARTIASGDSFFVNGADIPSVRAIGEHRLAAHWLWNTGADAHEVRISRSDDGGHTWSRAVTPHRDGTPTEHGFASLLADRDGTLAVWLDGRKTVGHTEGEPGPAPDMTLRSARIDGSGRLHGELELDGRTCDCCPTSAAMTDRGPLLAYRDRDGNEVRDIAVMRREGGRWSAPRIAHADGWKIAGCPVNGPSLDARGLRVALAWYTAAADSPRVLLAFSEDAGDRFGTPIRVDEGNPIGRTQVALLADGSALVTWMETTQQEAEVRVRRVARDGTRGAAVTVSHTSGARRSGMPKIGLCGATPLVAWTTVGEQPQVRVARLADPPRGHAPRGR